MIQYPDILVPPWDLGKFQGERLIRDNIIACLANVGLDVKAYKDRIDNKRIVKTLAVLLNSVFNKNKLPWITIMTNDPLAQLFLSELLPITYALSTHLSACNITMHELVDAAIDSGNSDDSDLGVLMRYGMLVFRDFASTADKLAIVKDRIFKLLSTRFVSHLPTVFILVMMRKEFTTEVLYDCIEKRLGPETALLVASKSSPFIFKSDLEIAGKVVTL